MKNYREKHTKLSRLGLEVFLVVALILIFSTCALAIGVSPAKTDINPTKELFYFSVLNTNNKNNKITVTVPEKYQNYILLSEKNFRFDENQSSKLITGNITAEFKKVFPGENVVELLIEESAESDNELGLLSGIKFKLIIQYPEYGKKISLGYITNSRTRSSLEFTLPIENIGSKSIDSILFEGKVLDSKKKTPTLLTVSNNNLQPFVKSKLTPVWNNYGFGNFTLTGVIEYDGLKLPVKYSFEVPEFKEVINSQKSNTEISPTTTLTLICMLMIILILIHWLIIIRNKRQKLI